MKKNNLSKISLLLLVLNFRNIYTDRQIQACQMGMNARAGWPGANLMTTGDETLSGNYTCNNTFTNLIERAACIYGYNNNWPSSLDSSRNYHGTMRGNGCPGSNDPWISNEFSYGHCPAWFGYGNNPCCVDGWDACDYGKLIGWDISQQSFPLNFYKKFGTIDLLSYFWGRYTRPWSDVATNWNNLILRAFQVDGNGNPLNNNGDQNINSPSPLTVTTINSIRDLGIS